MATANITLRMMKHTGSLIRSLWPVPLAALLCLAASVSADDRKTVLVESKRIWDKGQNNSFTDLITHQSDADGANKAAAAQAKIVNGEFIGFMAGQADSGLMNELGGSLARPR